MGPVGQAAVGTSGRAVQPVALRSASFAALVMEADRLGRDPTLARVDDERLVEDLCRGASELAASTCRWLTLLGEVVVRRLWAVDGARTPGAWLSWRLGIGSSTAREHVRVALALRELPATLARFAEGTLSYSKVRAITRVADESTEAMLLRWADATSAAELERIVADGRRLHRAAQLPAADEQLGLRRRWRDDGRLEVTVVLDPADGIAFEQHLDRLVDLGDEPTELDADDAPTGEAAGVGRPGPDGPSLMDATPTPVPNQAAATPAGAPTDRRPLAARAADALLGAVGDAVAAGPDDGSGLDRHLAVIELTAAQAAAALIGRGSASDRGGRDVGSVPAPADRAGPDDDVAADLPAAADEVPDRRSTASAEAALVGVGRGRGLERAVPVQALRRFLCGSGIDVVLAAIDRPVDLGRTRRFPDVRLRRLLQRRDRRCRVPGCGARRWLHGHHVVAWADDGATDLDNLVLLCGFHHRLVHAQSWTIERSARGGWTFGRPGDAPDLPSVPPRTASIGAAVMAVLAQRAAERDDRALLPVDDDGFGHDHELTVAVLRDRLEEALPREPHGDEETLLAA